MLTKEKSFKIQRTVSVFQKIQLTKEIPKMGGLRTDLLDKGFN